MRSTVSRVTRRGGRRIDLSSLRQHITEADRWLWGTPENRLRSAKFGGAAFFAVCLVTGAVLVYRMIPKPPPDYTTARIDEVMGYTLLTDEFNKLPVEKRLQLVSQLVSRFEGMGSQESVLLAAFSAKIKDKAREQLEENVSRLMVDVWDRYAEGYAELPPAQREAYLDQTMIELYKTAEMMDGGRDEDKTDQERLTEIKEQAKRDQQYVRENGTPPGRVVAIMFDMMNNRAGSYAAPQQRARGQLMMRDMVRRARGTDPGGG